MKEELYCIVYSSSATELFDDQALVELLQVARKNNRTNNLTGMLLYSDGVFLQALEGAKEKVQEIYKIISRDPRHKGIIVLRRTSQQQRQFSDWEMGFQSVSREKLAEVSGYSEFLNSDFDISQLDNAPSVAWKMLVGFRQMNL